MSLRTALSLAAATLALCLLPTPAHAWFNGPDDGNGFGTHDWVLYEALMLAQPSWIDTETALQATDDPDRLYGEADRVNHSYLSSGSYRGAPDRIAGLYQELMNAYVAGDYRAASHTLGVLSHYWADMCVPFHTRLSGAQDLALHWQYENAINQLTLEPGVNRHWLSIWSRRPIDDVRARSIDAAMVSRAMYPDLEVQMRLNGYNETVEMMSRVLLSRAVNDLADLILSLPAGSGVPDPVRLSTSVSNRYPSVASGTSASTTVLDRDGAPVEGVRVEFVWNYPTGSETVYTFSAPNGVAKVSADPARLVKGRKVTVSARPRQPSALAPVTTSTSAWFIPTEEIGYMKTKVSPRYPSQRTSVVAETTILSKAGQPMQGLPVTYQWKHKTTTIKKTVTTDAKGVARHSRGIGAAALRYRVYVTATVPGGGIVRTESTSFVPSHNIATMESRVSSYYPRPKTKVTARTTCLDSSGEPIVGAKVTFAWRFRTTTYTQVATTNDQGVARASRDIGKATRNYPVYVTSSAPSGSSTKTSMTWFTPRVPPPPPSVPESATVVAQ